MIYNEKVLDFNSLVRLLDNKEDILYYIDKLIDREDIEWLAEKILNNYGITVIGRI